MLQNNLAIPRKREDFDGQLRIVIPQTILDGVAQNPLIKHLYLYSIGFYPKARYHYCERNEGSKEHIIVYCVSGNGWLEINNVNYPVKKGQCFFIPLSVPHRYGASQLDPWSIYWVHFRGSLAQQWMNESAADGNGLVKDIRHSGERLRLFHSVYTVLESGYSRDNMNYVNLSLGHLLSSFFYPDHFLYQVEQKGEDIVERSIEFMKNNLSEKITLQMIALHLNVSVSRYTTTFKKKVGFAPLEYYNQLKMQKACQMLHFTDWQIKKISVELGITDAQYFSRLFSQVMGMSPLKYRSTNNK